ncbi:MAG: hypothetical protein ACI4EU_05030 [Butyrivibrio sp.]
MKIELELHDARKELPTESKEYLMGVNGGGYICNIPYSAKHKLFNAHDDNDYDYALSMAIYPDWWAEIPEEMLSFPVSNTVRKKKNIRFETEDSWRKEI